MIEPFIILSLLFLTLFAFRVLYRQCRWLAWWLHYGAEMERRVEAIKLKIGEDLLPIFQETIIELGNAFQSTSFSSVEFSDAVCDVGKIAAEVWFDVTRTDEV